MDFNECSILFTKVKFEYENLLNNYSYNFFEINNFEIVYIIEDSFIVYLGIVDFGETNDPYYYVVIDELLDNNIFNFNFSSFLRKFNHHEESFIKLKKFHGLWAEPIRSISEIQYGLNCGMLPYEYAINYEICSKSEYINSILPELNLKQRYEEWDGYLYHFIVYELKQDGYNGYAIYSTRNPFVHKIAREKAKDIEWCALNEVAWLSKFHPDLLNTPYLIGTEHQKSNYLHQGVNCDEVIIKQLIKRIEDFKKEGKTIKHSNKNSLCLAEHDLKYFYISLYVKSSIFSNVATIENEIFEKVHNGYYLELPRYEYIIPENKWKSEQLVFELTKKIFKGKTILYQHRPHYLKSEKGQLSYDIFICGLNVAIEYQGKQHFEPVKIFGGEEHFKSQIIRDKIKYKLSQENGIALVYINYWDDISAELIKERVEAAISKRENLI